uniref:RxLR effector protein n=1 Tax=Heterorhabditis bacteriophora TaxID=37862 RepID=A0A1I7X5L7_HETBA
MRVQFVLSLILITVAANAVSRQAQVNKAIEQTKSRQTAVQAAVRVSNRSQKSPGRNEVIDVDRLNRLIRAVDKTWILPKAGAKEPIGSNFQANL